MFGQSFHTLLKMLENFTPTENIGVRLYILFLQNGDIFQCRKKLAFIVQCFCQKFTRRVNVLCFYPGWKTMAAMPWSYHDHGGTWSWSYLDDGMAAMFLGVVVMIQGMIMLWLPCFLWFITWSCYNNHFFHVFWVKMDCLSMFFQIVAVIHNYMAHLTGFRGIYTSKVASQQNEAKITPERLRVFFGKNQTTSFY